MISKAIYYDNKTVYNNDYIISIDIPDIIKYEIESYLIIHNTTTLNYTIINDYFNNRIFYNYKIIYTSDISEIYYDFINELNSSNYNLDNLSSFINTLCSDNRFYNIIIITSNDTNKFNNNIVNSNINIIQFITNNIYLDHIYINKDEYPITINTFNHIDEIFLMKSKIITIIDSNMTSLINTKLYYNYMNNKLIIFIQDSTKYFNNYISFYIEHFKMKIFNIKLEYVLENNFQEQILGIHQFIANYYLIFMMSNNFKTIKQIYSHTINYYNKFVKNINNYPKNINLLTLWFNKLQDLYLLNDTNNSNPADKLFNKSLSITNISIKNKSYKVYNKNRAKSNLIKINNLDFLDSIDSSIDSSIDTSIDILEKSLDFYSSLVSLTNWKDELENNSCIGLLINVSCYKNDILGFTSETINIHNITNTFISPEQIYDGQQFFFEKYCILDNGNNTNNLISGAAIGKGNAIVPLYINKYHWLSAKNRLEEIISVALTQNPYCFKPIMLDIYAHVLLKFMVNILNDYSDKNIIIFIGLITTFIKLNLNNKSYEYFMDNTYDSIEITNCKNMRVVIISYFINCIYNGYQPNISFLIRIHEEIIRRTIKKLFINKYTVQQNIKNNYIMELYNLIKNDIFDELNALLILIKFNEQINYLLNKYDLNLGYLDETDILKFKNEIKSNTSDNKTILDLINDKFNDNSDKYFYHLIIQTFINRYDKNKIKAIKNNKHIDICTSGIDIINNNINKLIKIALQ